MGRLEVGFGDIGSSVFLMETRSDGTVRLTITDYLEDAPKEVT